MKRILIVSQYFYPENFKANDIAFELVKRGYQVDVLTAYLTILMENFLRDMVFFADDEKE